MTLPNELQQKVDEAVEVVRTHSQHEMGYLRRKAIYDIVDLEYPDLAQRFHAWLGVIACRKVIAIYDRFSEENIKLLHDRADLPARLLQMTEALLNGKVTSEEAFALSNTYYHVIGHATRELSWSSKFVARAVSIAFYTAEGFHPHYRMKNTSQLVIQENKEYETVQATEWDDETLALKSVGEVATSAAFAYACVEHRNILFWQFGNISQEIRHRLMYFRFPTPFNSPDRPIWERWERLEHKLLLGTPTFDSNKLLEFWEWWLTEAIPQAWEKAHS